MVRYEKNEPAIVHPQKKLVMGLPLPRRVTHFQSSSSDWRRHTSPQFQAGCCWVIADVEHNSDDGLGASIKSLISTPSSAGQALELLTELVTWVKMTQNLIVMFHLARPMTSPLLRPRLSFGKLI